MADSGRNKAVVLLSSGLDSSFNLYKAHQELDVVLALTFDYGQRAASREVAAAAKLAALLKIPHHVLPLPWFKDFAKTALLTGQGIPSGSQVKIDDLHQSHQTAKSVWVPNRNGILLNIAAGFAEGAGAGWVIPGFNLEEAQTFPDNTADFLGALDGSFKYSTANQVRTRCYSVDLTKTQIVKEAHALNLPFQELWPCYLDEEHWCGQCESCQRFARALEANHLSFAELRISR